MTSPFIGLEVEEAFRPEPGSFRFDLDRCLASVVALEARVADDAYSAGTLGSDRIGNAIVIGAEGLVLTIGYLITEAEEVILTTGDGRRVPAHVLGVDQTTGFGLAHALDPLDLPALPIGDSRSVAAQTPVLSVGGGGRAHALSARLVAKAPFAGYWEYCLDEALFVAPAHPHWSGAALIGPLGELIGVGSLRMEQRSRTGALQPLNMFVPAELLTPIRDDLAAGRPATPPRPWIGVFTQEADSHVVVIDVSSDSPAEHAGLMGGDVIHAVAEQRVKDQASFYKAVWAQGPPGVTVPLTVRRGDDLISVEVTTIDRTARLKKRRYN